MYFINVLYMYQMYFASFILILCRVSSVCTFVLNSCACFEFAFMCFQICVCVFKFASMCFKFAFAFLICDIYNLVVRHTILVHVSVYSVRVLC